MKSVAFLALIALVPAVAAAQTRAPRADALECGKTIDGQAIQIGTAVRDVAGNDIGSVSLSQCNTAPNDPTLRVFVSGGMGGEVKAFPLKGVTVTPFAVILPLAGEEITDHPAAPEVYAQGDDKAG